MEPLNGDAATAGEPWTLEGQQRARSLHWRRRLVLCAAATGAVALVGLGVVALSVSGDSAGADAGCLAGAGVVDVSGCEALDTDSCACFTAATSAQTWAAARDACVAEGGDLAKIGSSEANDAAYALCAASGCWLGLHRAAPGSAEWVWGDGSAVDASFWASGGGAEADGECAVLYGSRASSTHRGRWTAARCSADARPGLCTRPVAGEAEVVEWDASGSSTGSSSSSASSSASGSDGSGSGSGTSPCTDYVSQDDCQPLPDDWSVPELDACWADGTEGTVFGFMGDYGLASSYCEAYVAALIEQFEAQWGDLAFLANSGDNNYWSGDNDTIVQNIGQYYSRFFPAYGAAEPAPRFWPTLGNHDWWSLDQLSDMPYFEYLAYLRDQPGGYLGQYYSVEAVPGVLDLFMLNSNLGTEDSEEYVTALGDMKTWVQAAMEASTAPFKAVAFHHPYYSTAIHDPLQSEPGGWPFEEWGADIVFTGHEHAFERILQPDHGDLTYILQGLGGHPWRYQIHDCEYVQPGSQVRYNSMHAAMVGIVSADTLTMCTYNVEGEKLDTFSLSS